MTVETRRPNLLFIMADQFRHDFLGSAGAGFMRTPNLDRLAAGGVRFTQCVSNCPVCAPARIGLATGIEPRRLGGLSNDCFLPRRVPTYYQRLRDHGYRVGCVGKLDLAKPDTYNGRHGDRPCVFLWGFTHPEECEGKMHAGSSVTPIGPYTHFLQERGLLKRFHEDYAARKANGWIRGASHDSVLPTDAFEDVYIGRRAAEWIENIPDDFPWHLFVSFVGPHDPFDPPTEYGDRWRHADIPPPVASDAAGKPAWIRRRRKGFDAETVATARRQYCAAIELIDDQIGRILDALCRRGMADDTFVIFSSDHGEMLGDHDIFTKSVAYEGALRVPLLIAGPGIRGGRTSHALVELVDLAPTICDLVGVPPQENLDGLSLAPVLCGDKAAHRENTFSVMRGFTCLRADRYKLIENANDTLELYDLQTDPGETRNIASSSPNHVSALQHALRQRQIAGKWMRR